jgi:hypothetical protein
MKLIAQSARKQSVISEDLFSTGDVTIYLHALPDSAVIPSDGHCLSQRIKVPETQTMTPARSDVHPLRRFHSLQGATLNVGASKRDVVRVPGGQDHDRAGVTVCILDRIRLESL